MSIQRCCHVKINGARCTMPAVNGAEFCYHHDSLRTLKRMRPQPAPPKWLSTPLFHLRYPDNYEDLVFNSHLAIDAFARHEIDYRQLTAATRHFEMIRKCLIAAERHKKLHGRIEETETTVTEFRRGEDGELLALPDPAPAPPAPPEHIPAPSLDQTAAPPDPPSVPNADLSADQPNPLPTASADQPEAPPDPLPVANSDQSEAPPESKAPARPEPARENPAPPQALSLPPLPPYHLGPGGIRIYHSVFSHLQENKS